MSAAFDPYHKWLGIPASEQPPSCYRLLGVRDFEDDPDVIEMAADQRTRHLRSFQTSKHAELAKKLLNEVARANRRLLDPEEKAEYDAQLREARERETGDGERGSRLASQEPRGRSKRTPTRSVSEGGSVRSTWVEGKAPATVDDFVLCVAASRILTADEVRKYVGGLSGSSPPESAKALAAELVKSGKLTKFQAQNLLLGKPKYLSFGEYVILDRLGQGGMGQVLKAEHRRMKRTVALKVIASAAMKDADAIRRFQREVHAAARLIHPNIVTAFDANEYEGVHFFVMEHVEGQDLGAVVKSRGPLPVATAVDYVLQAARGLGYAHSKGIVHRDIKPSNLLVDNDGTVKILDMGLARIDLEAEDAQELTNTGQVMGTIDYMAPEQAEDTHSAGPPADIYSLGCTLYRLLTGELLYSGETLMKKLLAHRTAPIPNLRSIRPDVPPALETTFQRMVAKQPQDRQQSMTQVVTELEGILRGEQPASLSSGSTEVTQDIKLSEFLSGLGTPAKKPSGKQSAAAVATKPQPKVAPTTEVTQDLSRGDTSPSALASVAPPRRVAAAASSGTADAGSVGHGSVSNGSPATARKGPPLTWLIAGGAGAIALLAAAIVIFLPASDGTIRVEINDPAVEVTVSGTGYKIKGPGEEIHLKPGEHTLHVRTGELEFDTRKFVLGKGANPAVKVELLAGRLKVIQDDQVLGESGPAAAAAKPGAASAAPSNVAAGSPKSVPSGTAGLPSSASNTNGWIDLFNGRDLAGWLQKGHAGWSVSEGAINGQSPGGPGWLMTSGEYDNFELELEYRLQTGGNSGIFLRAAENGVVSGGDFHEIQLLDDSSPRFSNVRPEGRTGSLFGKLASSKAPFTRSNEWHQVRIRVFGQRVQVTLKGTDVLDGELPGGKPAKGHIGLQLYSPGVSFRRPRLRELNADGTVKLAAAGGAVGSSSSAPQVPGSMPSQAIDLLQLVDASRDAIKGQWTKTGEGLVSDGTVPFARLKFRYTPPREYDYRVEFTAQAGNDILQLFAVGPRDCTWLMGAWGGKFDGFDVVEGHPVVRKGTGIVGGPSSVRPGQRHTAVVQVRRDYVAASIDGKPIVRHATDGSDLRVAGDWLIGQGAIGLGSTLDRVVFHKVEIIVPAATASGPDASASSASVPSASMPGSASLPAATRNSALSFDGQDDLVRIDSLRHEGNQPLTVEAWVLPRSVGRLNTVFAVSGRLFLQSCKLPGRPHSTWQWVAALPAPLTFQTVEGPPLASVPEKPVHLAGIYTGREIQLFIDGRRVVMPPVVVKGDTGRITPAAAEFTLSPAGKDTIATIGGQWDGAKQRPFFAFDGQIDEVRISNVVRYDQDFTPATRFAPDDKTLALYHFNEGQGEALTDYSANGHHGKIAGAIWSTIAGGTADRP